MQELVPASPVYHTIPIGERKWIDIPANKFYKEDALSTEISKLVKRFGHYDQDEREFDGAVHWGWWDENCEMLPWSMEVQNSQTWIGSKTSLGEAARSGFNVAWVPKVKIPSCIFVPFKDTLRKKEDKQFSSHVSILCLRTIQKKNGQATTSRNREMKHHRSKRKTFSGHCLLGLKKTRAQNKGLQFWQTRSNAIVVCSSVPSDRLDFHQRLYSKVLGKRSSSSSKTLLKVHLLAAGNNLRGTWWRKSQWRIQELRERFICWRKAWIESRPQSWRNCSRCNHEGWRANWPNTKGSYTKSIREDLRKPRTTQWSSARNPNASFTNWATSSCTILDKCPTPSNAIRAANICRKD